MADRESEFRDKALAIIDPDDLVDVVSAALLSAYAAGKADCLAEINALNTIPASDVAGHFIESESLYYQTKFDPYAKARLTSVIARARIDGRNTARETKPE